MKSMYRAVIVGALVAWVAEPAWAIDVILRRSTTTKGQGEVTKISKTGVTVKPRTGEPQEIPANDIVQIEWTGEPAAFKLARSDENGGRLQKALDAYTKLADTIKGDSEGLKADLQFFTVRAVAKMALADPAKLADAIKGLNEFKTKESDSFHYYEALDWLSQLQIANKDTAGAKATLELLGKAPFNDYKMAAKIAAARQNLLENNIPDALAAFEEVSQMKAENPAETSKVLEAKLGVAQCLQAQKEYDKANKLLDEVIAAADPEDDTVHAEAYLRQGDCLQAAGKPKEALRAYLHVDLLFSAQKSAHAEALFHLAKLWGQVQQPERGAEAAERLAAEYPNSPWTEKVKAPATE